MIYVSAFSWLVFDVVQDAPTILGTGPVFICGRASVDTDADVLVVTTPTGGREVTSIAGSEMRCLARRLLREMHAARYAVHFRQPGPGVLPSSAC